MFEFPRMHRLPPYVFSVIGDLKMQMRRQNIDIVDMGMGNPDIPTPQHIVDKLAEAAAKGITRGKQLVILVGSKKALNIAVSNNKMQKRFTYLAQRLANPV